jgi:anthranilate phosphoribosyltransferase
MSVALIGRVVGGENLTMEEMSTAVDAIVSGSWSESEIAMLLTALHFKGETADEVAGAALALRKHMTPIHSPYPDLLDTCGTGGGGSHYFNISTAAALVAAAAGVPVAKHGNRRITSRSGSADVLAELGVNVEATPTQAERCLADVSICFCFAPLLHQSMKQVAAVRAKLGFRTVFNLLGPLCNPAGARYQLLGVTNDALRSLMSACLQRLDTRNAVVVWGTDGLGEVTLTGATRCTQTLGDSVREICWTPSDFGLEPVADLSSLSVSGPSESAAIIRQVLDGARGPARDIVILNAAAALWTVGRGTLPECAAMADDALDSGRARETLRRLVQVSHAT